MTERGIYWATTAGNHDTEADLTRDEISAVDRSFEYSLTLPNQANISHAFNYMLPVYNDTDIGFRLWFLDTGHDNCLDQGGWDCVRPDQVEWFRQEHSKINTSDSTKGKGFLFIHIPIGEYLNLFNDYAFYGEKGEDVCCGSVNTGLFAALKEQQTVEWVSCGHDHDNDFYGTFQGINLAYGRKTGFGGYGPDKMARGARVFEVTAEPYTIETWVREDGGKVVKNEAAQKRRLFDFPQSQCCGMAKANMLEHIEKVKSL